MEGQAKLISSDEVFYNPIQQFNRDISVMAIKAWSETYPKRHPEDPYMKIVEGLAASGLRSCRYALEIPQVKQVVANDLSEEAVSQIKLNAEANNVTPLISAVQGDASHTIRTERGHVIDLDPYGSAAPFIDAAVQSVFQNGLLLITCTDLAVLAGNAHIEKCFSTYGGTTLHGDSGHESALRLLLNSIAQTAAKYGRAIKPLLSFSVDYYIRVIVQVKASKQLVKQNLGKSMIVYTCPGCKSFYPQPLGSVQNKFSTARGPVVTPNCTFCGTVHHIAGPMWSGPLHDREFLQKIQEICKSSSDETYGTKPRIMGVTELALQELEDVPFYISPASMGSIVKSPSTPPMHVFTSALFNGGFKCSLTHCKPGCVKTDAPFSYLWDLFRQYTRENKQNFEIKKASPGAKIMETEPTQKINFEYNELSNAIDNLRNSKIVKFQENPRADWGPQSKARKAHELEMGNSDKKEDADAKKRKTENSA